jgi:hypothetical protein
MQEYKVTIDDNGTERWYNKRDKLHRDGDKPAIVYTIGTQCWYVNGKRHRDGDKPAVIYHNGDQCWYKNGKRHRKSGPAIIYATGMQSWYINGTWRPDPVKELTVADIESLLGYRIKVVKSKE